VRPEDLGERTRREIVASLEGRLARFKLPTTVRLTTDDLPRTAAGKVLKRELRETFKGPA
jgi:acyl-CoA synthetase (AMP-forming)/AMP-acid ligase II